MPRPGTSDGSGHVVLPLDGHFDSVDMVFLMPDGTQRGRAQTYGFTPLEQLDGVEGVQNNQVAQPSSFTVAKFNPRGGNQTSSTQPGLALQANNPLGGIMVFAWAASALQSYDENAQLRWSKPLNVPTQGGSSLALVIGVDRQGNTLVLYSGKDAFGPDTLGGIWVDPHGNPGPNFLAAQGVTQQVPPNLALFSAVGKGLFLQQKDCSMSCSTRWTVFFAPFETSGAAPPAWLSSRPDTDLHLVHGGTAYGVLDRNPGCTAEVLTDAGQSCGKADFSGSGATCQSVQVGYDGTVITLLNPTQASCDPMSGDCSATWHWWPGFFQ